MTIMCKKIKTEYNSLNFDTITASETIYSIMHLESPLTPNYDQMEYTCSFTKQSLRPLDLFNMYQFCSIVNICGIFKTKFGDAL